MKILIFGITGMIGSAFFKKLSKINDLTVLGTVRTSENKTFFDTHLRENIYVINDVMHGNELEILFNKIKPNFVINCTGIIKQNKFTNLPLIAVPLNSLFPHKLANYCSNFDAKLIQLSTDCVFSGFKGNYNENDIPDASDLYGLSKIIGEICYNKNVLTIRTSVIGHELFRKKSFLEWVVNSKETINGYTNALYSGLTIQELVDVTLKYVFTGDLYGLYHISSDCISKFNLIKLICSVYDINIDVIPYNDIKIDRTLDSKKFKNKTGYKAPSWEEMIEQYYQNFKLQN